MTNIHVTEISARLHGFLQEVSCFLYFNRPRSPRSFDIMVADIGQDKRPQRSRSSEIMLGYLQKIASIVDLEGVRVHTEVSCSGFLTIDGQA